MQTSTELFATVDLEKSDSESKDLGREAEVGAPVKLCTFSMILHFLHHDYMDQQQQQLWSLKINREKKLKEKKTLYCRIGKKKEKTK